MKRAFFILDLSRCYGCLGCVAACANANSTPEGIFWRSLHKLVPENSRHDTVYLSISCNHCLRAPCIKACPTESLSRDNETGAVVHNQDSCIGCRYCQMACPYDAISWDAESGMIGKCDFCNDRIRQGRDPACVETCFADALTYRILESEEEPECAEKEFAGFKYDDACAPSIRFRNTPSRGEGN